MEKNLEISLLLDFYGGMLTDKQRDAVTMYYNEDMSLSEIGETLGISRQGVRDAIKRSEAVLTDAEAKIGFYNRFKSYREGLTAILSLCKNIADENKGYSFSRVTDDGIKKIRSISQQLLDEEG